MRNFDKTKRIVIKIGTNTLAKSDGTIDSAYIRRIASQIAKLLKQDKQVVLVSSGAIGMGAAELELAQKVNDMKMRQACAAIGQPVLMHEYHRAFKKFGVTSAQVLLTAEVLNNRKTYLNLRNSVEKLLALGVLPIINENDSVSTEEIGSAFGDNDKLSALVASKIDADLLIMLSDIDAFYDKDPRKNKDAQPIDAVFEITDKLIKQAGARGSKHATGGMKTKIEAAKIASSAGTRMIIANGREKNILPRIMTGVPIGTIFMPKRKLSNRQRWILNSSTTGTIQVDDGAIKALRNKKSLLPSGIKKIQGSFEPGSVVMINDIAKAVADFSSTDLNAIAGKHSSQVKKILGNSQKDTAAIPENIVFLDF
jgi:glutamate 5-kinase